MKRFFCDKCGRSMNLSTKTLNMSMIALLRRLNARRRINLISKILAEIEDNQMKIADLEIALQEN